MRNENNNIANLTPTERLLKKKFNPLSDVFDTKSQEVKAAEKELELHKSLLLCSKEGMVEGSFRCVAKDGIRKAHLRYSCIFIFK